MYCPNCGNKVNENADVCLKCGTLLKGKENVTLDKPSIGLNIISFLWPLIGFILYLTMKRDTPVKAKKCGKWALIGVVTVILIFVIVFAVVFISLNKVGNSDIAKFSSKVEIAATEKYKSSNLNYSKCYNINEILSDIDNYSGSVRVTRVESGYVVKTYISKGNYYLVSEYHSGKRISFNMKNSSNFNINNNCSEY